MPSSPLPSLGPSSSSRRLARPVRLSEAANLATSAFKSALFSASAAWAAKRLSMSNERRLTRRDKGGPASATRTPSRSRPALSGRTTTLVAPGTINSRTASSSGESLRTRAGAFPDKARAAAPSLRAPLSGGPNGTAETASSPAANLDAVDAAFPFPDDGHPFEVERAQDGLQ